MTGKLLCVDEMLNNCGHKSILKARNVVVFIIDKATQAKEKLKQKQKCSGNSEGEAKTVAADVATTWRSTHAMIESLLLLRMMAREGPFKTSPRLTDADWNKLEHIMLLSTPFKNAQKMSEGNH